MSQEVGSPASFGNDLPTDGATLEAEAERSVREFYSWHTDGDDDAGAKVRESNAPNHSAKQKRQRSDPRASKDKAKIRFPAELFGGLLGDDRAKSICKGSTPQTASLSSPWRGTQREGDKQRLADYVSRDGSAKWLSAVVRDVFGKDSVSGDDADYQLARRFFDRYPDLFRVFRTDDLTVVEPKVGLLRQRNVNRKNAGRRGDGDVNAEDNSKTGVGVGYPKDRVRSFLGLEGVSGTKQLKSETVRRGIFGCFASWRRSIDGTYSRFDSYRDRAPSPHLLIETE
ncbi:hypothetical protein, partial [Halorubrum vacuolatum]